MDRGARRPGVAPVLPARDRRGDLLEIGERHAVGDEARRPVRDRGLDAGVCFWFGLDDCGHAASLGSQRDEITRVVAVSRSRSRTECGRQRLDLFRIERDARPRRRSAPATSAASVPGSGRRPRRATAARRARPAPAFDAALRGDRFDRSSPAPGSSRSCPGRKRGCLRRMSCAAMSSIFRMLPVRRPRPSGE